MTLLNLLNRLVLLIQYLLVQLLFVGPFSNGSSLRGFGGASQHVDNVLMAIHPGRVLGGPASGALRNLQKGLLHFIMVTLMALCSLKHFEPQLS